MVTKFGTGVDIDNNLDGFTGQGHRSLGQKTSFSGFSDLSEQISSLGLCCDDVTSHT